jgi:hypothetical protein
MVLPTTCNFPVTNDARILMVGIRTVIMSKLAHTRTELISECIKRLRALESFRPVQLNLVAQKPHPALRQAALLTNWSGMVCSRTQVS